jgi:predicted RecA/RadA family phage recombinase
MANAFRKDCSNQRKLTSVAAVESGEIYCMSDGRAGVMSGVNAAASGDKVGFSVEGIYTVTKVTGWVGLDGGKVYWDHSANSANYLKVNDKDFYLGTIVGDAASTDLTIDVNLNVEPVYLVDINRDPCTSVVVGTPAAGVFGYPKRVGGSHVLETSATSEAQKVDIVSDDGFAITANAIVEFAFNVVNDGAGTASDWNIGCASGTHATDFESIAEFIALHVDENALDVLAHSDDGTTDTALVDTTINHAVGTRFEGWIDIRDETDPQIYCNGSLVLGASDFGINDGTGPLYLIAHLEKTTGTDTFEVSVDWLRARIAEV